MYWYIMLTASLASGVVEGPLPATEGMRGDQLLMFKTEADCAKAADTLSTYVFELEEKEHGEGQVNYVEAQCFTHEKPGHDI